MMLLAKVLAGFGVLLVRSGRAVLELAEDYDDAAAAIRAIEESKARCEVAWPFEEMRRDLGLDTPGDE